jgi:hypothetical protein
MTWWIYDDVDVDVDVNVEDEVAKTVCVVVFCCCLSGVTADEIGGLTFFLLYPRF